MSKTHIKDLAAINAVLSRGVHEVLPDAENLAKLMAERPIKLYLGIDPTGAVLHLGHSVVLRKLKQFTQLGHEVILLIGSGTVKIGDPTGRDASRPELTDKQIEENFKNWKRQASKVLDFSKVKIMRNGDWLDKLNLPEVIKLLAKTTVQQLLERDMFQDRLKNNLPIHTHELIYPLLQGYDSVAMDVDLEVGGTDQTFNMMVGRSLQKAYNNHEKWVLTMPLINGTDGRKMSKSFNNYVALEDEADEIYGKLMSIKDDLIIEYFTLLTDVAMADIESMHQAMEQGTNPMEFKKKLAFTITQDLHDEAAAKQAQQNFEKTVQGSDLPSDMPVVNLASDNTTVLELLKTCPTGQSANQLKRLCTQGAVALYPQEERLTDPFASIKLSNDQVIKVGKRNFYQLKIKVA